MNFDERREKLTSSDAHHRRVGVHGAETCLDLRVVPLLVRLAKADPDPGVRSLAAHSLRLVRQRLKDAERLLLEFPEFRPSPAEAGSTPPAASLDAADAAVRHKAVGALAAGGDPAAVPALLAALAVESEGWVRAELAWAVGRLGGGDGAPEALRKLLKDPVSRARANAVEALWSIKAKNFEADALPLLEDADRRVRANTAVALCVGHWGKAEQVLMRLARSPDRLDREAALFATGQLPGHRKGGLLEVLQLDPDEDLRARALRMAERPSRPA